MKIAAWGGSIVACVVAGAPAMAAPTLWQGDLFVTSVNNVSACKAVNTFVGDYARFNFRPKSIPGNGFTDLLSWTMPRSAGHMSPNGGLLDTAATATLRYIFASAGFSQVNVSPINATVSPPAPTAVTATVQMTITISNFYSSAGTQLSGCHATFKGALTKRPN